MIKKYKQIKVVIKKGNAIESQIDIVQGKYMDG